MAKQANDPTTSGIADRGPVQRESFTIGPNTGLTLEEYSASQQTQVHQAEDAEAEEE